MEGQGTSAMEEALREAISKKELFLNYQPVLDIHSGRICGVEALMRWRRDNGRLVSPADFIPLMEASPDRVLFLDWLLQEAMRAISTFGLKKRSLYLSINVTPTDFLDPNFVSQVVSMFSESGEEETKLTIEVTDAIFQKDPEFAKETIAVLKSKNVGVQVDNYEESNLMLDDIKKYALTGVKVDISLVSKVVHDEDIMRKVKKIVRVAKENKLQIIAQGVENREQLGLLKMMGCEWAQGFLFHAVLSDDQLKEALKQS